MAPSAATNTGAAFANRGAASAGRLLRLWCHEACRVFGDRLCEEKDRVWFEQTLRHAVSMHSGGLKYETSVVEHTRNLNKELDNGNENGDANGSENGDANGSENGSQAPLLLYGNFIMGSENDTSDTGTKREYSYREIVGGMSELSAVVEGYLREHNSAANSKSNSGSNSGTATLPLVLFRSALEHTCRVSRILVS